MAEETEEKRRYFRINDSINLRYKIVDEKDVNALSHVSTEILNNCTLADALDVLNQEMRMMSPRLERRDPELFEYLKIMDAKIGVIAQALTLKEDGFSDHDKREVSLSASGLAFSNDQTITVGAVLELRVMLTSCLAVIVAFGRVLQCKDISKENAVHPFEVCVEYINLQEEDRELLVKHVVKKQLQQLRDKNTS